MNPLPSTILSTLFLIFGAVAVFSMFTLLGSNKSLNPQRLKVIHKVSGWMFVALFVLMFVTMIGRIEEYWEESSARIALHVALAVALFFLLLMKILIPRFFPKLGKHLFALGISVYLSGFMLVVITGGYHVVWILRENPYISHAGLEEHMLDERMGKELFITKCSTCHALDSIMAFRSVESWEEIINRMVEFAEPRIKPDEGKQILYYLVQTHVPRVFEGPEDASPVEQHCLPCHDSSDIYVNSYSRHGWLEVVSEMNTYDQEVVPKDKIEDIVEYLLEKQGW